MSESSPQPPLEVCKALADPVRWAILERASGTDEVPCQQLDSLPVSKPTISYHLKILSQAGLITLRKAGRNYYYSLDREALHTVLDALWALAPSPRAVVSGEPAYASPRRRQRRTGAELASPAPAQQDQAQDEEAEVIVLTW